MADFCRKVVQKRASGKLLSLDVGTKHVGLALTDESRRFVIEGAVKSLSRQSKEGGHRLSGPAISQLGAKLQRIINEERACGIVVGIPLKDGEPTPFCKEIVDFMLRLDCTLPIKSKSKSNTGSASNDNASQPEEEEEEAAAPIPFTLWDEQYSTMEGRRLVASATNKRSTYLRRKDSIAASVILTKFLSHAERVGAHT